MDAILDWLEEIVAPFRWTAISARVRHDLTRWCDIRVTSPLAALAGLNCLAGLVVMCSQGQGAAFRMSDSRLCVAAAAAAGLAVVCRWALSRCQRSEPAFWIKTLLAAFSVLPLAALFTAATPQNSLLAISFVSALAVVAGNANLVWRRTIEGPFAEKTVAPKPARDTSLAKRPIVVAPVLPIRRSVAVADLESVRSDAKERLERTTDASGNAVLEGRVVVKFRAGQSLATAHIPFLPPFDRVPDFSCDAPADPAFRIRAPAVFRYGARLELKRSGDVSHAVEVPVEFQAIAGQASLRAA